MNLPRLLAPSCLAAVVLGAVPATALAAANPPPIPADQREAAVWFVVIDGQAVGPLTESGVVRRLAAGEVGEDALVWRDGMTRWVALSESHTFRARGIAERLGRPDQTTPTDGKFQLATRF